MIQHEEISENPELAAAIRFFEQWVLWKISDVRIPGMSVGVVYDQELVWAQGFGLSNVANQTPANENTLYRIASNSKLFTATAIMQLRDAGKLRLDDPVADHLDWFTLRSRFDDIKPVTIRHLLTHTSGLPRDDNTPMWTETRFPDREAVIAALPDREMALEPETQWKYSNLGYALLGEIVTAVSGRTYADYVQTNILNPLNMQDTHVVLPDSAKDQLAKGYGRLDREGKRALAPFTESHWYSAAFNLASNITDLAKFMSLQFRRDADTPVLRGTTLNEMQRAHWVLEDWNRAWGLGFEVARVEGKTWNGHGGAVQGHFTGQRFNVDDKIGVIVLTNATHAPVEVIINEMIRALTPAFLKVFKPEEKAEFDPAWEPYIGAYTSNWGDTFITRKDDKLMVHSLQYPEMPPGTLKPLGEHRFRMEKGGMPGEEVRFIVDESGAVTRIYTGGEYADRMD